MSTFGLIIFFTFFASIVSLLGVVLFLRREKLMRRISMYFTSFASGVLLAIVFFDLFPEAVEKNGNPADVFLFGLVGFLAFFLIERAFHWHHRHEGVSHQIPGPAPFRYLIMIGDLLHNFLDGTAVAATFLVSPALGIATSISVFFHEIPKEISDVSLLIHSGMTKKNAILFNMISAVAAFLGAIIAFLFAGKILPALGPFFAFAAGNFLYIASVDLIPEIQEETKNKKAVAQVILLFAGIFIMWGLRQILPHG